MQSLKLSITFSIARMFNTKSWLASL